MASVNEAPPPKELTPAQVHALFDILTHHETYAEIEGFKSADAVEKYGYPFSSVTRTPSMAASKGTTDDDLKRPSESPILQTLLTRIVLSLPGVNNLPRHFWSVQVQGILSRLGDADLSESYDKGALGLRKTLASGAGSIIEMLGRGALGGVPKMEGAVERATDQKASYDLTKAEDLERAWEEMVQGWVYGDLVDRCCTFASKSAELESFSPAAKAAVEYAIIHLATFAHHVFIMSPEGQYLLKLMENVHNLIPYKMVKQTLRVGNAATMISGMMRLLLAKLSVTSITNWVGLTNNADDGMNLLQRIISLTLSWDSAEFKKSAERIAKERQGDEALAAIREFVSETKGVHGGVRDMSIAEKRSIVTAILMAKGNSDALNLSDEDHASYLEYYSALLSVHDREAITTALCRQPPDLFTQMVRDVIAAYDPIIRDVHAKVDLREHLEGGQGFIDDFIKASKPKKDGTPASVADYVELLMRNRALMYRWINALGGSCPGVWEQCREWGIATFAKFRQGEGDGGLEGRLKKLFSQLPSEKQAGVVKALDEHAAYLQRLKDLSKKRLQNIINETTSKSSTEPSAGPGMYLSRWQDILDTTPITPAQPTGPLRCGKEVKHTMTMGKSGVADAAAAGREQRKKLEEEAPKRPDVSLVIRELGDPFKEVLKEVGGPR
ncbi:hypothetical protein NLU13_0455 [Sarocladium strictum]|uniref:Px domain containing protein n=1 Tax=Sarocladium strictum TaxID=5046 RepID=A0AA39GP37_SARSR|nr:hypothetical protein NLU13_0455 [Sarocladium strictum]